MRQSIDKSLGYVYFIDKDNPLANSQGKVYVHRHIWFINTGENPKDLIIHHKDNNKQNNEFKNLEAVSRSDHGKIHKPADYLETKCLTCGNTFSVLLSANKKRERKFCSSKCYSLNKRIVNRPSVEELKKLINIFGFSGTARKFGVSDNAVRKWIK